MKPQHILIAVATTLTLLAQERFDHQVRADFFAGFAGDSAALARGMKKSEDTLQANPKHAEALVWHGAGLFFLSGQSFQKKDMAKGMELYGKGIGEMSQAVALEPNNIGVRVPRAAALSAGARFMPPEMAKPLFESVLDDYTTVYQLHAKDFDQLGTHRKGELLFGLADTYSRLGATDKADQYYKLINEKMPNTAYAKRAEKWFETRQPIAPTQAGCIGCHTGK
jgi:tetratricopeptide (TPR) repeat protein